MFVYAPLGFLLEAHRLWPEVVARGRQEVEAARARGFGVVDDSRDWFEERLRSAVSEAGAALRGLGLVPGQEERRSDQDADQPAPPAARPLTVVERPPVSGDGARPAPRPEVPADTLAIPGYDSLSASQVVPRLAGLDPEELELVRKYELAGRGRKTILSRIAQLQDG